MSSILSLHNNQVTHSTQLEILRKVSVLFSLQSYLNLIILDCRHPKILRRFKIVTRFQPRNDKAGKVDSPK
jgi:hypothetical protein